MEMAKTSKKESDVGMLLNSIQSTQSRRHVVITGVQRMETSYMYAH